jgi:hypothetical protein
MGHRLTRMTLLKKGEFHRRETQRTQRFFSGSFINFAPFASLRFVFSVDSRINTDFFAFSLHARLFFGGVL